MRRTSRVRKLLGLANNYVVGPLLGRRTTASFWYRPESARYRDPVAARTYLGWTGAGPPPYLMDYTSKVDYDLRNEDDIVVIGYGEPIGPQVNPEAAFIFALAQLDEHLLSGSEDGRKDFMRHALYFRDRQAENGDWTYDFDWPGNPAPWSSALAQGRGCSVMTRAWILTGDDRYLDAARRAVARFDVPISEGGYRHVFPQTGTPYFEEYPKRPIGVLNGFMASLIGLFELAHWGADAAARELFDAGIRSLEQIAPHYLESFGSVYDRNPDATTPNINSPRYHRLCISYFEVLWGLTSSPKLADHLAEWRSLDTRLNGARALVHKAGWKVRHGVFIE